MMIEHENIYASLTETFEHLGVVRSAVNNYEGVTAQARNFIEYSSVEAVTVNISSWNKVAYLPSLIAENLHS